MGGCPPSRRPGAAGSLGAGALAAGEPALEALHPAAGVHELLLARVERVAVAADLHLDLGLGGPRLELVAAGTADVRDDVFGVEVGLHGAAAFRPRTKGRRSATRSSSIARRTSTIRARM